MHEKLVCEENVGSVEKLDTNSRTVAGAHLSRLHAGIMEMLQGLKEVQSKDRARDNRGSGVASLLMQRSVEEGSCMNIELKQVL